MTKFINMLSFKYTVVGKIFATVSFVFSFLFAISLIPNYRFFENVPNFMQFFFAILVTAFSAVYLYFASGRKKGSDEIQIYFIDKLWTEVTIITIFSLFIIEIFYISNANLDAGGIVAFSFFIISPLVIFSTSIIRRLKSKTLYQYSFLAFITKLVVFAGDMLSLPHKLILALGIYGFITLIGLLAFVVESVLLFLLWGILQVLFISVVGYTIIQITRLENATKNFSSARLNQNGEKNDLINKTTVPYFKNIAENLNKSERVFNTAVKDAVQSERMRAELITNVSHDIKTPLTSIISYVNLLKATNVTDETALQYLSVLEKKSIRLAQLMNDLVDVSKISSGNISVNLEKLNFEELLHQAIAEYEDKFLEKGIEIICHISDSSLFILGDGRHMWRVLDNLLSNAVKYTMPHTRIYIDIRHTTSLVLFVMKNISNEPLNLNPQELTDRFVRGDDSRASEGSGLGLSIAESLILVQNSTMKLDIDGDLFKVTLTLNRTFPPIETMNVVPENGLE